VLGGQQAHSRCNVGGIGKACGRTSLEGAPLRECFRRIAIQKQYLQQLGGYFPYGCQPRPVRVIISHRPSIRTVYPCGPCGSPTVASVAIVAGDSVSGRERPEDRHWHALFSCHLLFAVRDQFHA
jgi:hypothetical protein